MASGLPANAFQRNEGGGGGGAGTSLFRFQKQSAKNVLS